MTTVFPQSIFSNQTLRKVAGGFNIPQIFFEETPPKREFRALNYHELQNIWREEEHHISANEMTWVVDMYHKMTIFDAYFLATRLPLIKLEEITGMPKHCAAALKRACNYLRDMDDDEYRRRDTSKPVYNYFKYSSALAKEVMSQPRDLKPTRPAIVSNRDCQIPYEFADDKNDIIKKLRPYMNQKQIKRMPTTVKLLFKTTPKHVLKRLWSGTGFEKCYEEAMKQ